MGLSIYWLLSILPISWPFHRLLPLPGFIIMNLSCLSFIRFFQEDFLIPWTGRAAAPSTQGPQHYSGWPSLLLMVVHIQCLSVPPDHVLQSGEDCVCLLVPCNLTLSTVLSIRTIDWFVPWPPRLRTVPHSLGSGAKCSHSHVLSLPSGRNPQDSAIDLEAGRPSVHCALRDLSLCLQNPLNMLMTMIDPVSTFFNTILGHSIGRWEPKPEHS